MNTHVLIPAVESESIHSLQSRAQWIGACIFASVLGLMVCFGCSSAPKALVPASLSPAESAQRAIESYDTDGDSMLDFSECSPGFRAVLASADRNSDGKLDASEISERLSLIESREIALTTAVFKILKGGKVVKGKTVRLIPDPVFRNLSPASGVTDEFGFVSFKSDGQPFDGVQPGLYSVELLLEGKSIAAKKGLEIGSDLEDSPVVLF